MKNLIKPIFILSALLSMPTHAASVTYNLTEAANTQWTDGFNYVTVTIDEISGGNLHFFVQGNSPVTLTAFAFNLNLPTSTTVTLTMDNPNVGWSVSNGNSYSIFGMSEYETTGSGNNPANAFGFTIDAALNAMDYALNINLFENNSRGYFMFANVKCPTGQNTVNGGQCANLGANGRNANTDVAIAGVPVPAAAWLFGSALLGFVGVSTRRRV